MAVVLWHAPEGLRRRVQGFAGDVLRPGCVGWQMVVQFVQARLDGMQADTIRDLQERLKVMEAAYRRESEQVARLSTQLAALRESQAALPAAVVAVPSERLFVPALIEAGVLGGTTAAAWREGRVLDRGWKHGVREAALVLQSHYPLIDLGASAEIAPEDPVLWGRIILGKVQTVGRWSSTYIPVSDVEYRGRAQLVRDSEQGPVWGPQGLLKGEGPGRCRLEGIPIENAVRVGDLVCSAERDAALPYPLIYGRVIDAQPAAGEREWSLLVEPAAQPACLTQVQVLRAALNPARFWGN